VPYLVCQVCGSRSYSAASHATVEDCPVCGAPLPQRRRTPAGGEPIRPRALPKPPAAALRAEITERLGRVPALFEPAFANSKVIRELWRQTQVEWLDSPIPAGFRQTLVDALAVRSPWPWAVVAEAIAQSVERRDQPDLTALLAAPLPEGEPAEELEDWPDSGTPEYTELLALTVRLILNGPEADVSNRLLKLLGPQRYASLVELLSYLDTCRTFAQAHPDLAAAAGRSYRRTSDPHHVALLEIDQDGTIASVSPAAEELFGRPAPTLVGRPLAELATEEGGALDRLVAELAADDARLREQSLKVVARRGDGTPFDAALTVTNRSREGKRGMLTAIVDRERVVGRPDHAAAHWVLVSLVEGGATTLPPDAVLAGVARTLGWAHMLVWRHDPEEDVLRCVSVHELRGPDRPPEMCERAAKTFAPGSGMVGTVFQNRAPAWVEDLSSVEETSLGSGLWLPVSSEGEVEGVVELLSDADTKPERAHIEMFETLARGAASVLDPQPAAAAVPATAAQPADAVARARLAFEGAPVAMALVSIESGRPGAMIQVNRAMSVLTGREPSQLVGLSIDDITEPDDIVVDADLFERLLAGEIPSYEVAKRIRHADGRIIWGELSVSLVRRSVTREPLYLVVQLADVSERKRIEDALHLSRDRLASVFDEAPIGMAIASLDRRWLQVNQALCETMGYSESDLMSKRLRDLLAPDEVETIERYLRQLMAGEVLGYHVETRAVRADGEEIWIQLSVSLVHDFEGSPAYVLTEMQDISERKRLEEELEQGTLLDAATGLPSRTLLYDRLAQASARLERHGSPFVVMFVACDGFDVVARSFGRDREQAALREMSARLLAAVRAGDTVARYGDADFVVVCEDLESHDEAGAIARRVLELGQFKVGQDEAALHLGVTLGITVAASSEDSPAALVERADAAMHMARREGVRVQEYCDAR
jgi:PAS domain S-box-containing protein/diguanylate cyclase (GGDEF)-like protein